MTVYIEAALAQALNYPVIERDQWLREVVRAVYHEALQIVAWIRVNILSQAIGPIFPELYILGDYI
jgi:hypothetical protein